MILRKLKVFSAFVFLWTGSTQLQANPEPVGAKVSYASFLKDYNHVQRLRGMKPVNLRAFQDDDGGVAACYLACQGVYNESFGECMRNPPSDPGSYYDFKNSCDARAYDAQLACELGCFG